MGATTLPGHCNHWRKEARVVEWHEGMRRYALASLQACQEPLRQLLATAEGLTLRLAGLQLPTKLRLVPKAQTGRGRGRREVASAPAKRRPWRPADEEEALLVLLQGTTTTDCAPLRLCRVHPLAAFR